MIKTLFAVLLGVLLAFFVGLGIEAFYPAENYPEQPKALSEAQYIKPTVPENGMSEEQLQAQKEYNDEIKAYQDRRERHSRNVSAIAIVASIVLMILSLTILQKTDSVFPDGFLLGAILTLIYGIIRGFEGSDNKFRFLLVAIGLAVALTLGYFKFIRGKKAMGR